MQSTSNCSEIGSKVVQKQSWNILTEHHDIKIDEKFVLKLTKLLPLVPNVNKDVKNSCKVLHFSSERNFEDVMLTIDGLDPKEYPQLFIFIIEATNFGLTADNQEELSTKIAKLQEKLLKFGGDRPMILQLTSDDENNTKIYFKEETSRQFNVIDQQQDETEELCAFKSFLCSFFNGKFMNFEIKVLDAVRDLENCTLILRFLRTLQLSDGFFGSLVLDVASDGSRSEFVATLDSPLDSNGRVLSYSTQRYISDVFGDDDPENCDSVLLTAIKNENTEVTDYLITYWTHLIKQLPFKHQVQISTAAFETNQLDFLCDLLDIADYPFPKDFKLNSIEHPRLSKIAIERTAFKTAIEAENFEKINEFINTNPNLKLVYNPSNNSALTEAVNLKKFGVFYYLKSLSFQGEECDDILEKLSKEEKEQAVKLAIEQKKKNVNKSEYVAPKTVMLLSMRSSVHNSRTEKIQASKYREQIIKWFADIHKVAPELIDVAASCDYLKIIFDFESESVENMSLTGSHAAGSTYPLSKCIFVGSKLSDTNGNVTKQREQKIKGVLAHELCHYVMRLVYDNQEKPYYKDREDMKEMFEEVVKIIDKWSSDDSECPDDECNGIISSIFTLYKPKDFHPELIVRVVQILSEFDDSEDKLKHLEQKYEILFDFWQFHVLPQLQNFLLRNEKVIRMNRFMEIFQHILNQQIEIKSDKNIKSLVDNSLVIVVTNYPKLLLLDICKHLKKKFGNLIDSKILITDSIKLEKMQIWNDFKLASSESQLIILLDCTKEVLDHLGEIITNKEHNFIFVVSNEGQSEELIKIINEKGIENVSKMEINYNFADLTEESQNVLMETKINFQNNPQVSLIDLFKSKSTSCTEESSQVIKKQKVDYSDVIDNQLFSMLLENSQIFINCEIADKKFELLFNPRKFYKKKDHSNQIIFQENLLAEIKNQQYVLISDIAGNGKSWAMKFFAKILREHNPTSWVTYVDLKQFIDEFKAQKGEPEFSTFMIKNILKLQQKFEIEIFQKLYKSGKVFILFDGFDEIAPNYAKIVSNLAHKFQQNGGNQLWIATRDYFKVDLQKKLEINISYSLVELSADEGIDIIAKSWMLIDVKDLNKLKSKGDFNEFTKKSPNYDGYKEKARLIVEIVSLSENRFIGMPQLIKMIADGFKDYNDSMKNLKGSNIYRKFIKNLYDRWSSLKGPIRKEASIDSQEYEFNFWKFHQYCAFFSFFPQFVEIFFPDFHKPEWTIEEIIACGLLTMINGQLFFLHETLREFFFADFIAKSLQKSKICDEFIQIFVYILTHKQFSVVRIFLNDAIDDHFILEKIQQRTQELIQVSSQIESFSDFFTKDLDKLTDFIIEIIKSLDYEKVLIILDLSIADLTAYTNIGSSFLKFEEFFLNFVKIDDLKNLIINHEIFLTVLFSKVDIEIFESFVAKVEAKTDRDFIRKGLTLINDKENWRGNIFFALTRSLTLNCDKFDKTLEILQRYFTVSEIIEMIKKCNKEGQNIFRYSVRGGHIESFKLLWTKVEKLFSSQKFSENFKDFIKQKDLKDKTILHWAAKCENENFHEILWDFLLKTFDDRKELLEFILQKKKFGCQNFVHSIFQYNKNHKVTELTIEKLKENFSDQFKEIIKSENISGMSLIQIAVLASNYIECYQKLSKIFKDSCESEKEYLELINNVNRTAYSSFKCNGAVYGIVRFLAD